MLNEFICKSYINVQLYLVYKYSRHLFILFVFCYSTNGVLILVNVLDLLFSTFQTTTYCEGGGDPDREIILPRDLPVPVPATDLQTASETDVVAYYRDLKSRNQLLWFHRTPRVGPAFSEYPVQESEPNIPQWVKMVSTPLGQFRHACQLQFEQPNYSGENIQNFHNSVNLVYPGYSPEYISNVVNQVPLAYKKYTEIGVGAFGNLNHPL